MDQLYITNNILLYLKSIKKIYPNIIEIFSINDDFLKSYSNNTINEYNINIKYRLFTMDKTKYAITIQKIWRGYKQRKKALIVSSIIQTKKWRETQNWYKNGKYNECENYQKKLIQRITGNICNKSNMRINTITYEMKELLYPLRQDAGFEWTENFDGIQKYKEWIIYYNLKMICDSGGSQTRTLREVYHFISSQLYYLKSNESKIIFVNILDGDESYKRYNNFMYLLNKKEFSNIKNQVYIGDMYHFQEWFISFNR